MARLKELYKNELAPKLQKELGLANVMEIPRITKITLNMGVVKLSVTRSHLRMRLLT